MSEKTCLVVDTKHCIDAGLMPEDSKGRFIYTSFGKDVTPQTMYELVDKYGKYLPRYGDEGVEERPEFQQFIMYAFFVKDGKILVYQRDTSGNHSDKRLSGKISVGLGGHMEPTDMHLEESIWREIDEEAEVALKDEIISFRDDENKLDIEKMKEHLSITPVGLLKDGRDDVGMVHLGMVCMIESKADDVEVRPREEEEIAQYSYLTYDEYEAQKEKGDITPEGWTEILMNGEVKRVLKS